MCIIEEPGGTQKRAKCTIITATGWHRDSLRMRVFILFYRWSARLMERPEIYTNFRTFAITKKKKEGDSSSLPLVAEIKHQYLAHDEILLPQR